MPSNHYNKHFKNGHKPYVHAAYRYHSDIPTKEFVNWNTSKLLWMIMVVCIVLGIIFLPSL